MQGLTVYVLALLLFVFFVSYVPTGFYYISITELFTALYSLTRNHRK
jgi:hypothetical protein